MNTEIALSQSIDIIQNLSESNAKLTNLTEETFDTAFAAIKKCEIVARFTSI